MRNRALWFKQVHASSILLPLCRLCVYNHTDQRLQDDSNSVYVYVSTLNRDSSEELCDVTKRSWQFYHGDLPGPSSSSHNKYVEDRRPVPHILGNDISLEKLLALSRQWLTSCIVDHKKCGSRSSGGSSYLPTRLLDIGSPGQPLIQLVLSEDFPKSQKNDYITLSYCWGPAKYAACTTKANLIERLRAIPTSSLPKILADAVEIVHALRVKYLWIDALCIIQAAEGEESEDWEEEFPSTGKTYQHSPCTIAASGAEHSSMGCFYRMEAAGWPVHNYILTDERRELGNDNPVIIEATLPNWNISWKIRHLPNAAGCCWNGSWHHAPCSGPRTACSGTVASGMPPSARLIWNIPTGSSRSTRTY